MADTIYGDQTARDAAIQTAAAPVTQAPVMESVIVSANPMQTVGQNFSSIQSNIESQITAIQEQPLELDVSALIGVVNDNFNMMKNRITESALASVKKSALELDAYFNSPTGDQRAGARLKMSQSIKGNLMQSAYQAIASVYDQNTKDIISLSLEGAKANASIAGMKANAVTSLMGQLNQAYLGVLSETNKNYLGELNASIQMSQIQLDTQFRYDQLDQQKYQFDKQLDVQSAQYDTDSALKQQQIDLQKSQIAMESTAKMIEMLKGSAPNYQYTPEDITNIYKSLSKGDASLNATYLEMSGFPDQERMNRFASGGLNKNRVAFEAWRASGTGYGAPWDAAQSKDRAQFEYAITQG